MNMGNLRSAHAGASKLDDLLSGRKNGQGSWTKPPGPLCLKMLAWGLAGRATKVLAGAGFIGGVIAMGFLGPAAIPVLVVLVSLALYTASTATSLLIREPHQSQKEILRQSVADFAAPTKYLLGGICITIAFPIACIYLCVTSAARSNRLCKINGPNPTAVES